MTSKTGTLGRWPSKISLLLATAATAVTFPAAAQHADAVTADEEIIVNGASRPFKPKNSGVATKIEMDVVETPQAITVISRELMDMVAPMNIGDVALLAPGVRNGERDVSPIFDVTARGFPVSYSRGFRINTLPFTNNGIVIDFDSVDHVEVVRGPSSIIYGQADYGTTVNVDLKKPLAKAAFEAALTVGSYNYKKASIDATGPLVEDGSLRGRTVISYEDRDSRTDYVHRRLPSFYGALAWDAGANTTVDLSGFYNRSDLVTNYGFSLTSDNQLPDVPRSYFQGPTYNHVDLLTAFVMGSVTHKFNENWKLTGMASYAWNDVSAREAYISGKLNSDGEAPLIDFFVDDHLETFASDLTLTGDFELFGGENTIMLNGYYSNTPTKTTCCYIQTLGMFDVFDPTSPESFIGTTPPPLSDSVTYASSTRKKTEELAFGGLLLLRPLERLTLMAGARWTQYDTTTYRLFTGAQVSTLKDSAVTPRFGIVYGVTDDINVYGSYSQGIIFQSSLQEDGTLLGPEKGTQWEVGTKGNIIQDRMFFGLALFDIERSNVAVTLPQPNPNGYVRGISGQRHRGVELELVGEPIPGLNLFGSYSYLDVKVSESPIAAEVGRQRANSPHHQLKLYSNYEFKDGALKGLTFGGGFMHVSSRQIDNIGSYRFSPYTRVDLQAAYDLTDHISLSVNAINVGDVKIPNSICGATGSASCGIIYQDPRTIYGKVAFRF